MIIDRVIKRKSIIKNLENFADFTSLDFCLEANNGQKLFQTDQFIDFDQKYCSPININGEQLLRLVTSKIEIEKDKNQLAFDFLHEQLESVFNAEFSKEDLVKTTARFWKEMNFMYNFLSEINYLHDVNQLYQLISERIAKLFNVTRVSVVVKNEENINEIKASFGSDEIDPEKFLNKIDFLVCNHVLQNKEDMLINDLDNISPELEDLLMTEREKMDRNKAKFYPMLCSPLKTPKNDILGAIRIYTTKENKFISSDDQKLLNSIVDQVSLVINNINMINEIRETENIKKEMELASIIQKGLLPKKMPQVEGLDVSGKCVSANAVGGDYYDVFQTEDVLNFVLADVSGHGISSALFMSNVRSTLRSLFLENTPLTEIAFSVNNFICSDSGVTGMFVTLFYARYYPNTKELAYINSGHNQPVLYRRSDDTVLLLDTEGTPAGFIENTDYQVRNVKLLPNDVIIMFTDGFVEAVNKEGEMLGFERLLDIFKEYCHLSAEKMIDKIYDHVYKFSESVDQKDDMTILVIKNE